MSGTVLVPCPDRTWLLSFPPFTPLRLFPRLSTFAGFYLESAQKPSRLAMRTQANYTMDLFSLYLTCQLCELHFLHFRHYSIENNISKQNNTVYIYIYICNPFFWGGWVAILPSFTNPLYFLPFTLSLSPPPPSPSPAGRLRWLYNKHFPLYS